MVSIATARRAAWLLLRLHSWSRRVLGLLDVVCGSLRPFLPQTLPSPTQIIPTHILRCYSHKYSNITH